MTNIDGLCNWKNNYIVLGEIDIIGNWENNYIASGEIDIIVNIKFHIKKTITISVCSREC